MDDVEAHRFMRLFEEKRLDMEKYASICSKAADLVREIQEAAHYISEIKELKKAILELQSEVATLKTHGRAYGD